MKYQVYMYVCMMYVWEYRCENIIDWQQQLLQYYSIRLQIIHSLCQTSKKIYFLASSPWMMVLFLFWDYNMDLRLHMVDEQDFLFIFYSFHQIIQSQVWCVAVWLGVGVVDCCILYFMPIFSFLKCSVRFISITIRTYLSFIVFQ